MSLGYAERLTPKDPSFLGKLGAPELFDDDNEITAKVKQLTQLIKESQHLVVYTGAGISTACGIPDFRGPNGIWTLQASGRPIPPAGCKRFEAARPSLTHMALKALSDAGILKYVISQNVDCLHLRSGLPRSKLSELHGNCFMEVCQKCRHEYIRDFELETVGLKPTPRHCTQANCRGRLKDTVLDWEDQLPVTELEKAEEESKAADVALCLGTSLQITPACNLPLRAVKAGGKMVIVNLQTTPKDKKASLVIRARCDEVMAAVMHELQMPVPPFVRVERLRLRFLSTSGNKEDSDFSLQLYSPAGLTAPLPLIKSMEVRLDNAPDDEGEEVDEPPFIAQGSEDLSQPMSGVVKLVFSEGCMCGGTTLRHPLQWSPDDEESDAETRANLALKAAVQDAVSSGQCGGSVKCFTRPLTFTSSKQKGWECEYAVITAIVKYDDIPQVPVYEIKPQLSAGDAKPDEKANGYSSVGSGVAPAPKKRPSSKEKDEKDMKRRR